MCWHTSLNDEISLKKVAIEDLWMWPNQTVPYKCTFYDKDFISVMNTAMRAIEAKTCIRFVPCGNRASNECLVIHSTDDSICQSTVGRQYPKQSFMLLNLRECKLPGLLQHELLHTIGFQHEHSRPDRDTFVVVKWDNVKEYAVTNFEKFSWSSFPVNTPYDYGSIMHYSEYSFAKARGKRTVLTFKAAARVIGQREKMSRWDIYKVNKLYQCPEQGNVCKDILAKTSCIKQGLLKLECKNIKWARENCMKTCNLCWPYTKSGNACKDSSPICPFWAKKGLCDENKWTGLRSKHLVAKWCAKSCNSCANY
uniref:Metalloendopeptidase n=1 Tax=Trichuris muris TaxID=70415 RepID=A0A5S6R4P4_TRIMR